MACNCLCCGCQTCTEAQEGKCCCGGSSGTCCQPGEFCCSGVCQPGGCGGCCCTEAGIDLELTTEAACDAAGGAWQPGVSCPQNPCGCDEYQYATGGCANEGCEEDIIALLESAGYIPRITFAGGQTGCGQRWLSSIVGVCCGTIGGDCGSVTGYVRCQGTCGDPPDCPDTTVTIEVTIPVCCNLFP